MRVLITGGGGFVGLHAARAALARGHDVVLTDIEPPRAPIAALADGCRFVQGDILADGFVRALVADVVIHCAAVVGPVATKKQPQRAVDVNVGGTSRVLEAARDGGARVILLSTATLYGTRPDLLPLDEDAAPDPVSLYDATKLMAETLCTSYRKTFGVVAASLRTGFVYGAGNSVGEYFVYPTLRGEAVHEAAGGGHPCDFTYVEDLALGLVCAAERPSLPEAVYNVTGGSLHTRGEFAAIVRRLLPQARITLAPGIDPVRHLRGACVITRAVRDFGYRPHTLEAGITDWVAKARQSENAV
jgi:nucleoside-diphosphate-sugar epimerase